MIYADNLCTEYLINPVGIDICRPRVSWAVADAVAQTAYELRICVNGGAPQTVSVNSSAMHHDLELELPSRVMVQWQVRLADEHQKWGPWRCVFVSFVLLVAAWRQWLMPWGDNRKMRPHF